MTSLRLFYLFSFVDLGDNRVEHRKRDSAWEVREMLQT